MAGRELFQFGRDGETPEESAARLEKMKGAVRTLLECIGEDVTRNGLEDTPKRVAKALEFLTSGYFTTAKDVIGSAVFEEEHDDMVVVKDIEFHSMCEHHMLPFFGKVHIGYLPKSKIVGLSKLARLVEVYSRRLQVQERLTKQLASAVTEVLEPDGSAVVIEATHMCMCMRGVQKIGAITTTSCLLGEFRENQKTREEFLAWVTRP